MELPLLTTSSDYGSLYLDYLLRSDDTRAWVGQSTTSKLVMVLHYFDTLRRRIDAGDPLDLQVCLLELVDFASRRWRLRGGEACAAFAVLLACHTTPCVQTRCIGCRVRCRRGAGFYGLWTRLPPRTKPQHPWTTPQGTRVTPKVSVWPRVHRPPTWKA